MTEESAEDGLVSKEITLPEEEWEALAAIGRELKPNWMESEPSRHEVVQYLILSHNDQADEFKRGTDDRRSTSGSLPDFGRPASPGDVLDE